ncbi:thioredoxin family protein [Olivibacter sitiensis]|uniref:thioredoxin family protein n=1 Tax=Olivibacter sitiensis TaxID=376470 RepID=UPI000A04F214|nr:thioredoxin family protein [Olivibacter sitiensis]
MKRITSKLKNRLSGAIVVVMASMMVLGYAQAQESGYQVGDKVADFSLKNIDGKTVSFSSFPDAKGYIVVFTCNTCPVAKSYEERIKELDATYKSAGYPVIAINPNDPVVQKGEDLADMQQRAKDKGFTFPYLLDPGHVVTKQFGATRTPHIFIVEKTEAGNVVQYIGAIDDNSNGEPSKFFAKNAVDELLAGSKPTTNFTKAVGCTIKWGKTI